MGPGDKDLGRRVSWPPELVDRALWTIALEGGSVSAAHRRLQEELSDERMGELGIEMISRQALQNWKQKYFRNRYHEILQIRARELDEVIAQDATVLARSIQVAEEEAVRNTLSKLDGANALEASTILRNLSQSKSVQLQAAGIIRDRPRRAAAAASLQTIAQSLNRIAGGKVIEILEGEARELPSEAIGRGE